MYEKRADADKHKRQLDSDLHAGSYIDPTAGQVTFRDHAEAWRKRHVHREGSAEHVESRLRLHAAYLVLTRDGTKLPKAEPERSCPDDRTIRDRAEQVASRVSGVGDVRRRYRDAERFRVSAWS